MILRSFRSYVLLLFAASLAVAGGDEVTGTLTVKGKSIVLRHGYASLDHAADSPARKYLVLLLSDVEVAESSRSVKGLRDLALSGKVHGLRIVWSEGFDQLTVAPYHRGLIDCGLTSRARPTIDIKAYDEKNLDATVKSKMLGQDWFFSAHIKAAIRPGGSVEIEPELVEVPAEGQPSPATMTGDATQLKTQLGRLGYEYSEESFSNAVKDGSLDAVKLFLKIGMSANAHDSMGNHVMILAATMCTRPSEDDRTEIMRALLEAKGDVHAVDQNNSTPLLWAAQSCDAAMVSLLIEHGANVNARAKGGATPLMMANVLGRTEIVQILQRAGAK
ncbi:MAG: ankyrin repeat domain-containing protein [Acidobacteria bacterium]|nr:ankyrin repeat domain-containing protein [Acidobacteriota bacterium]